MKTGEALSDGGGAFGGVDGGVTGWKPVGAAVTTLRRHVVRRGLEPGVT